jgi:C4-dicarboxylate transporter, DctM subunit
MSPIYVGYLGFVLLIVLTLLNAPLAISLGVLGISGLGYLIGWDVAFETLRTTPYLSLASYDNCVIPLFILMGEFCYTGGISSDLYATANKWLGNIRGGLAMATVGACALFAAVSGSSQATAAAMGTVALPEMKKYRYDSGLASGCVAAGGTIGIMIPPSVPLII